MITGGRVLRVLGCACALLAHGCSADAGLSHTAPLADAGHARQRRIPHEASLDAAAPNKPMHDAGSEPEPSVKQDAGIPQEAGAQQFSLISGIPAIAAVSAAPEHIDLFIHDARDRLLTTRLHDARAAEWSSLGVPVTGTPSAFATASGRLDLFVRKADGALRTTGFPAEVAWQTLGRPATDVAIESAAVSGNDQPTLVVVGSDHMLYEKTRSRGAWSPASETYEQLGGPVIGSPALIAVGPDRLDLIVRKDDGKLYSKSRVDGRWSEPFDALGAPDATTVSGQPALASRTPEHVDIVVPATDGQLYLKTAEGPAYRPLGAPDVGFVGAPKIIAWGATRLDVFVRGRDGDLYFKTWLDDAATQPAWSSLGAPSGQKLVSEPSLVTRSQSRLDIFVAASDRQLYTRAWDGYSWQPSRDEWTALGGSLAPDPSIMAPFWLSDVMYDESVLMTADEPSVPLLCQVSELIAVRDSSLGSELTRDVDYRFDTATNSLSLTSGAHSPLLASSTAIYEDHYFHTQQLFVTYRHGPDCWSGPMAAPSPHLAATRSKLAAGEDLAVSILGDSIAMGYSTSGFATASFGPAPPYLPTWPELVARQLEAQYGVQVSLDNASEAGQSAAWGAQVVHERVSVKQPDLVVIAFGMNDGSGRVPAANFGASIQNIMDDVRAENPACEFVLVAPMLANPLWTNAGDQRPYLAELTALANRDGTALADMTTTHSKLLETKRYIDMTGNGVNHPNDFLVRWYAQQVSGLLSP